MLKPTPTRSSRPVATATSSTGSAPRTGRPLGAAQLVLAALFLLGTSSACIIDDPGIEEADVWGCTTTEDCLDGFECSIPAGQTQGTCIKEGIVGCFDNDDDGFRDIEGVGCPMDDPPVDCDDNNGNIFPGAPEMCNMVDDDCDEMVDEDVPPQPCELTEGVCAGAMGRMCENGQLTNCGDLCPGDDCPYGMDYATEESGAEGNCGDGLDNDCDGKTDSEENEGGGMVCPTCNPGDPCGVECVDVGSGTKLDDARCACRGTKMCNPDGSSQCLDGNGNEVASSVDIGNQFPEDNCDASCIDDDCDGLMNDGCTMGTTKADCDSMFP